LISTYSVIFDLGGVVLRWNPDDIIRSFCSDEAVQSVLKREVFRHPDWLDMDRGVLPEHEAIKRFHTRTGLSLAEVSALMQAVRDSLQPIPGTVALLAELAALDVPLYCLSNMSVTTSNYVRARHSFWRSFRGIVISGEIKLIKPDPAIFEYMVERFGLVPRNAVFIDDHPPNIESANRLGFKTVLFHDPVQCRKSLSELLDGENRRERTTFQSIRQKREST
jgi:putative hydrolase of the HAD superfamily